MVHDEIRCADWPCGQCELAEAIARFMLIDIEPTDRALRPAGDIYPVSRSRS